MKKFLEEFKSFALRGNVMDMAVGVLIGGAFSLILLLGASILVKISIWPGYDNAVIVLMSFKSNE